MLYGKFPPLQKQKIKVTQEHLFPLPLDMHFCIIRKRRDSAHFLYEALPTIYTKVCLSNCPLETNLEEKFSPRGCIKRKVRKFSTGEWISLRNLEPGGESDEFVCKDFRSHI